MCVCVKFSIHHSPTLSRGSRGGALDTITSTAETRNRVWRSTDTQNNAQNTSIVVMSGNTYKQR